MPSIMAMTVIIGNETHSMGSIMSLLTMGHSLGMLLGPILAGIMMDTFHLETGFVIGTGVIFLGVIISLILTANFHILIKDSVSDEYVVRRSLSAEKNNNEIDKHKTHN